MGGGAHAPWLKMRAGTTSGCCSSPSTATSHAGRTRTNSHAKPAWAEAASQGSCQPPGLQAHRMPLPPTCHVWLGSMLAARLKRGRSLRAPAATPSSLPPCSSRSSSARTPCAWFQAGHQGSMSCAQRRPALAALHPLREPAAQHTRGAQGHRGAALRRAHTGAGWVRALGVAQDRCKRVAALRHAQTGAARVRRWCGPGRCCTWPPFPGSG